MAETPFPPEALEGFRVLEVGTAMGLFCGKLLADFGADVLKIERPGGDAARSIGPFKDAVPHPERSLFFEYYNTNKRGITLNLEIAEGQRLFGELVKKADVVVESFPPGRMARLGLGYAELSRLNPGLVMASISGFGQTGPHRDYKSPDPVVVAMGGLMFLSGTPEGPPVVSPGQQGYDLAGVEAATAIGVALYHRLLGGSGQFIDVSGQEVIAGEEHTISRYTLDGHIVGREGSQHGASAPARIFPAKDGFVHLFTGERWKSVLEWIGSPEALTDEIWSQAHFRRANVDVINPFVEEFTREHTRDELVREGQERHIPVTPVNTAGDFVKHPHPRARGYFVEVEHPELGRHEFPGPEFRMSETPWRHRRPAPRVGEHNEEVYCGELGLSREKLVTLREVGAI